MKKFIFLFSLSLFLIGAQVALAFGVPDKPQNFVNDYTETLSGGDRSSLESKVSNFEKVTGNEIAVAIIPSLDGDTIENVAQNIFAKWGIGKKDKNNGVLILVAIAERKTRIHTGYGVEGDLTDLETSYIQSEIMTPAFREGNYYVGINGAVDKIIEALSGNNIVPKEYSGTEKSRGVSFEFILAGIFILFQLLISFLGRTKSWWAGGVLGGIVGGIIWVFGSLSVVFSLVLFIFLIFLGFGFDFLVSRAYERAKSSGGHFPWWLGGGGFGGGNSSGGGFGGFGGGMSGGGGSSGSW